MGKFVVFMGGRDFEVQCDEVEDVVRLQDRFTNQTADPAVIVDITAELNAEAEKLEGQSKLEHEVRKNVASRKGKMTPTDRCLIILQEVVDAGKDGITVQKLAKMVGRKPQGFGPLLKPASVIAAEKGHNFYHYVTVKKHKGLATYYRNQHTNTLINALARSVK